ncbi:hypothetical protein AB205_0179350 [Aquarana catesbeiana]|uniref:Uncharacterized protein n=1 Tax=Aquarana catesbeiana TaxID=8400 RepID=A0A2G9RKA8_AQUCT|nr:hypothetical protein AB205_0179350 [Aquarana catesbeiana]
MVEMVMTTGDVNVVEEKTNFSSASAQILISEIMVCNRDLEKMKQNINNRGEITPSDEDKINTVLTY